MKISLIGGKSKFCVENRWWIWQVKLEGLQIMMTLDHFHWVLILFWLKQSLVPFLIRWKYHLLVEDVHCGWKKGGRIGWGSWGRLSILNLEQRPRVIRFSRLKPGVLLGCFRLKFIFEIYRKIIHSESAFQISQTAPIIKS